MRASLLAIGLGLIAALQAQAPSETQDISGKWYPTAAVVTEEKAPLMDLSPVTFLVLRSGNLLLSFNYTVNGQCLEVDTVLHKTEEPNKYSILGDLAHLYVEGSSVKDHCVLYSDWTFLGGAVEAAHLMSREPKMVSEALEDFKMFLNRKGLTAQIFLPTLAECQLQRD